MPDQPWNPTNRRSLPQKAVLQNKSAATAPPSYRAPFDAFQLWGVVSAIIFVVAGLIAVIAVADARTSQDLAIGIVAAIFATGGFTGIILSRIGTQLRRCGAR